MLGFWQILGGRTPPVRVPFRLIGIPAQPDRPIKPLPWREQCLPNTSAALSGYDESRRFSGSSALDNASKFLRKLLVATLG
jgi:hypothetical protein